VGENKKMVVQSSKTLIHETKKIVLEINKEKTKVMKMLEMLVRSGENLIVDNYVFEKAQNFKYLRVKITGNNDWNAKLTRCLVKA
jgi:hypothetical protein